MSGNEKDQKGKSWGRGLLGSFFFLERIFEAPSWQVDVLGRNSGLAITESHVQNVRNRGSWDPDSISIHN